MTMLMDVFSGIGHFKLKTQFVIHCNKRCYDYEKNTVNKTNLKGIQMVENWISGTRIPVMMMKIFAVIVT